MKHQIQITECSAVFLSLQKRNQLPFNTHYKHLVFTLCLEATGLKNNKLSYFAQSSALPMDRTGLVVLFAFLLLPCVIQERGRSAYQICCIFLTVVECWMMNQDCSKHLTVMLKLHLMEQQSLYISSNEYKIGILNVISYIKRQHYVNCSIQSFKSSVGEVKEYILFNCIPPMITQLCDMIPPK